MNSKRQYAKIKQFVKPAPNKPSKPFTRRCPSGEYEVMLDGLKLLGGLDTFEEGEQWIRDNVK